MSQIHTGKKYRMTPEGSARLAEGLRNRHAAGKISYGHTKGKPLSEEHKQAISRALTGMPRSASWCENISKGKKGKFSAAQRLACLNACLKSITGYHFSTKMNRWFPFRSLCEESYMVVLDNDPQVEKWDYEPFFLRYSWNGKTCFYLPDFFVSRKDGFILVEFKPSFLVENEQNQAKFSAARNLCHRKKWSFLVVTEKDLFQDAMPISRQAGRSGKVKVDRKLQRLTGEDTIPILPTRAPDTLRGEDIVRYPKETLGVQDKELGYVNN